MTTSPRLHFPELIAIANAVTFDGLADVQIEHRCSQLMAGFEPTASERYPASHMLAQTLRLIVGCRIAAASTDYEPDRSQLAARGRSYAAVAGALLPIVLAEKAEASR